MSGLTPDEFVENHWTEQPPGDDFDLEDFDDEELEQIAAEGDLVADVETSLTIAQSQLGRRIVPREVEGSKPYVAEQFVKGEQVNVRAAVDAYYRDNPKHKPDERTLRRERMAAAIDDANPQWAQRGMAQPPDELPAGATADQRREHRQARMAWAMQSATEQE